MNLLHLRESGRCGKGPQGLLNAGLVLSRDRVPCVVTEFSPHHNHVAMEVPLS